MIARTPRSSSSAALALAVGVIHAHALGAISTAAAEARPKAAPPRAAEPTPVPEAPNEPTFQLEEALVASDRGFTSDVAGKRARARAPQIASAEAAAATASWDQKQQWANFIPQVQLAAQYKRLKLVRNDLFSLPPGTTLPPEFAALLGDGADFTQPVDNYILSATGRIPVSDVFLRVFPSYKAARTVADARAIEVETRRASVDLQARETFYLYARALATQLVAEQALKQAEAQAGQAKLFVDAGTAAPVDFMTATARVESMRASVARTRGAVAIAKNTLCTLTGAQPEEVAQIRERVTTLPEPPTRSVDALLAQALERRPELRAMRKMIGANESLKSAEVAAALPSLSVEGTALYANPNPRYVPPQKEFHGTWEVGATVSWSPNGAVTGYQRGQRAGSEVTRARAELRALEDGVRIEVTQAFEDYQAASAAAGASEAQQRAAEETYRVRLATYRVGAGVQIDLLAADLALTQARLDYVNAVIDARTALARLRRAAHDTES